MKRILICVILIVLFGCGSGGGGGSVDSSSNTTMSDVNAELEKYPSWEEFAAVEEPVDNLVDIAIEASDQTFCTTTSYSLTENPEEIVTFGTAPDVLYLGSLIQGDSYLGGLGSMEELPIRQRAPLTIAIKVFTGTDITRKVEDPNSASVQQALSKIVTEAEDSGYNTGSGDYYTYIESYSSKQMALSLGVSYRCLGSSAKASIAYETSEETNTVTAYYKEVMFEAYIVRPQTPAGFFSADFTQELLDQQIYLGNIGPYNLPVYVSRIQYGRILMYSMTSTESMKDLKASAQYGYKGIVSAGTAKTETELKEIIANSEIKVVAIGGGDNSLRDCLISGNIEDYFKSDASLTTAEPIAYAVVNLADGSLAKVSETTEYDVRQCGGEANLYLDRDLWEEAVKAMGLQLMEWKTTPGNFCPANEVVCEDEEGTPNCGTGAYPNMGMGPILTWESSKTNFPFTFSLYGPNSGVNGLVYRDLEGGKPAFGSMDQERSISIGDIQWENRTNDDFELRIDNRADNTYVFAIGITVGDNTKENDEAIEAYYQDNSNKTTWDDSPDCERGFGFIGIVSKKSLAKLLFDERGGNWSDNIFVRDPVFGVWNGPIGEP